jgi:hypothetical protein
VIEGQRRHPASGIIRGLQAAIETFGSGSSQCEDITAVICKVGASA